VGAADAALLGDWDGSARLSRLATPLVVGGANPFRPRPQGRIAEACRERSLPGASGVPLEGGGGVDHLGQTGVSLLFNAYSQVYGLIRPDCGHDCVVAMQTPVAVLSCARARPPRC